MDKLKYFEIEKNKCQKFIDNISVMIKQLDYSIEGLKKSKNKTDTIINKFNIDCYNYNVVDEIVESRDRLYSNLLNIIEINKSLEYDNSDIVIERICELNDLLDKSFIQLKEISNKNIAEVEKLQMNSIKKEIYDKFMLTKAIIDRDRIKRSFDKMQNKCFLLKAIDRFFDREYTVDMKKENLFFAIHEIDMAVEQIKQNRIPKKEYKIIEILAEIELFLKENEKESMYKENIKIIQDIKENIIKVFSINQLELKDEIKKIQKSQLPVKVDRRMNKTLREKQKMIAFLTKNGYYKQNIELDIKSNLGNVINKLNIASDSLNTSIFKRL